MKKQFFAAAVFVCFSVAQPTAAGNAQQNPSGSPIAGNFTMKQALDYPYANELAAAENADLIAWVRIIDGVRNVWIAAGPSFQPRQITHYTEDDGQEITQLTLSPDGTHLVYVRGGDHDEN